MSLRKQAGDSLSFLSLPIAKSIGDRIASSIAKMNNAAWCMWSQSSKERVTSPPFFLIECGTTECLRQTKSSLWR